MAHVETSPGRLSVLGALNFATASAAREEGLRAIASAQSGEMQVDCAAVEDSDSAGLVVLLDWLAAAQRRNLALRFVNLPQRLIALAEISEIEGVLAARGAASTGTASGH